MGAKSKQVALICKNCGIEYKVKLSQYLRRKCMFCSIKCAAEGRRKGLAIGQAKYKVLICLQCGKEVMVHDWKYFRLRKFCSLECARAYRKGKPLGQKRLHNKQTKIIKVKQNQQCQICNFRRCIDAAHILPAIFGGDYDMANILFLCPNHHRLFDSHKLLKNEIAKLPEYARNMYNGIMVRRNPNNHLNQPLKLRLFN